MESEKEIKNIEEIKKEEMLREGNISLILDSYNDIFSDFDPRAYSEKALSVDFLEECRRAVRDKKEDFELELRLLIPKIKRNLIHEVMIKKRLKNHFQKHFDEKQKETRKIKLEGIFLIILGLILMFGATFLYMREGFWFNLLFVIFEPAGWFTLWSGLDQLYFGVREKKSELNFYKKMSKLRIGFYNY